MKAAEIKRLCKDAELLDSLDGFKFKGWLLYRLNECILCGYYFDSVSHNKEKITITAFALPLVVPLETIQLTYGKRLKTPAGENLWNVSNMQKDTGVLRQAVLNANDEYLLKINSIPNFLSSAEGRNPENVNWLEMQAYCELMLLSDCKEAVERLSQLCEKLVSWNEDKDLTWVKDKVLRADSLIKLFQESLESGKAELSKFIENNKIQLKL